MEIEPDQTYKIHITIDGDECEIDIEGWNAQGLIQQLTDPEGSFVWFDTYSGKFGIDTSKISRINIERMHAHS